MSSKGDFLEGSSTDCSFWVNEHFWMGNPRIPGSCKVLWIDWNGENPLWESLYMSTWNCMNSDKGSDWERESWNFTPSLFKNDFCREGSMGNSSVIMLVTCLSWSEIARGSAGFSPGYLGANETFKHRWVVALKCK